MEQALISTITILGRKVSVNIVPQEHIDTEFAGDDRDCQGYFDVRTCQIFISAELAPDQLRRVLMHEVSHAILAFSGLTNLMGNSKREEAICDAFESMLDLFRDEKLNQFLSN